MSGNAGKFVLMLMLLCCGAFAHGSEVRAWLDRNSMQLGETVTLNVEVSGDTHVAQPDLGALAQDFEFLGTQSSSSLNFINGQTSAKLLWAIGLQPKRAGTLTIPALDIAGQRTQPLSLNVQPASGAGKSGDDVYLEVVADPHTPYVQEQIRFTVKFYFALNFSDGALDDPRADGLVVRRLGQDANYTAIVGGKRYSVWERRYAMVPEKSGTLSLPPIAFRGHAIDPGDVNSFFSRGRAVSARSDPITFDVRPRPAASGNAEWLPAHSVTLTADGIDAHAAARVGEPMTLTLHIKAQGLGFEQLPELKLPKLEGADIYPDKSSTQNRDDGEWLYGERERKFAIVPNRAGTLVIPALRLDWWDTAHDRAALAELEPVTLNVEPAAAGSAAPAMTVAPTVDASKERAATLPDTGAELALWRTFAFVAIGLWIVTLLGWIVWLLLQRRNAAPRDSAHTPVAARAPVALRNAVDSGDWLAASRAVVAWARERGIPARNLGDVTARLARDQASVLSTLDRVCYGGQTAPSDLGARLSRISAGGLLFSAPKSLAQGDAVLPELYPERP